MDDKEREKMEYSKKNVSEIEYLSTNTTRSVSGFQAWPVEVML